MFFSNKLEKKIDIFFSIQLLKEIIGNLTQIIRVIFGEKIKEKKSRKV